MFLESLEQSGPTAQKRASHACYWVKVGVCVLVGGCLFFYDLSFGRNIAINLVEKISCKLCMCIYTRAYMYYRLFEGR